MDIGTVYVTWFGVQVPNIKGVTSVLAYEKADITYDRIMIKVEKYNDLSRQIAEVQRDLIAAESALVKCSES